jgi:DNA-binding transcriptional ArsR family regulator
MIFYGRLEGMDEQFVLKTTQHWKALAHPLRASILRLLTEQTLTNEQMAEMLCVESGKLYFHTKQLLDAGMIRVVETRPRGSVVEKLYQAVARSFISNGLPDTDFEEPVFDGLISDALWLYRRTWQEVPGFQGKTHYAFHYTHRIPTDRAREFMRRMLALIKEFQEARTEDPEAMEYSFALLYHAVPHQEPQSS